LFAYFAFTVKGYDASGKFGHNREPPPIDKQVAADGAAPPLNRSVNPQGTLDRWRIQA